MSANQPELSKSNGNYRLNFRKRITSFVSCVRTTSTPDDSHSLPQTFETNAIATNSTECSLDSIVATPSETASDIVSGWEDLPNELLMKIFSHLKLGAHYRSEHSSEKDCLLKTRLVNSRWKLVVDELLEKWRMEYWNEWNPNSYLYNRNPYSFPVFNVEKLTRHDILFPTKLVYFYVGTEIKLWNQMEAFSNYGCHLTSLEFHCFVHLPLQILANVLNSTPNLKVIAMQKVQVDAGSFKFEQILPPPLVYLQHIRFLKCYSERGSEFNWQGWFLKPYEEQLRTLEIDKIFEGLSAFKKLKRLKVNCPSTPVLKSEIECPSLQNLSLGCLDDLYFGPITLQSVPKFISQFSPTLVDLHIFMGMFVDAPVSCGKENRGMTFPLLKKFWTVYPTTGKQVEELKYFLNMFPNLETLQLSIYKYDRETYWDTEGKHLGEQQYWQICPRLKIITVLHSDPAFSTLYTMRAPFS